MIPIEELAASGIDRSTAARLNYRCNADGGWEIPYLDPRAGRTPTAMVFRSSAENSSQGQIRNT